MVKVILYLTNSEEAFKLELNTAKELIKFITTELKISNFNILFEKGEKISKNKMQKFEETLTKYKNEEVLNLLLISSENCHPSSKLKDELKMLNNRLEKIGGNNFLSNFHSTKNILENIFSVYSEIRTIENQNVIMNFLENFYSNLLNKIKNKFEKINENYTKYKQEKSELDSSFFGRIEELKKIFEGLKSDDKPKDKNKEIEIKAIEKSFVEFKKLFSIFEEKLKNFNLTLNNFIDNHSKFTVKNSSSQSKADDKNLKDSMSIIKQMYNEIMKNFDLNNFKDVVTRVETYWNKNNLKFENFSEIFKLSKSNSNKIKSMLDDQCGKLKKALLDKLSELNLLNKNIEINLENAQLPKIMQTELTILQDEIKKRKEFEYVFKRLMTFLNGNFLVEEEKRRNEFYKKMSKYSKNEIYKNVFNKICEGYNGDNAASNGKKNSLEDINDMVNKIEEDLNIVINKIYKGQEQTQNFLRDNFIFIENNNAINSTPFKNEINHNDTDKQRIQESNPNLQFDYASTQDNNAFTQEILSKQLERLNIIRAELNEILRENLKGCKGENELSRRNSEAVFVDEEELAEVAKITTSPKESALHSARLIESIEVTFTKLMHDLKKINDLTKISDNSNISNTSLINSIYISNLILNDKNQNMPPTNNEHTMKNNFTKNYSEVEKFVMLYEDKIYFFDSLFEYINNFIKTKNIKFTLAKHPLSLGRFVENILRVWLKTKSKLDKYKNQLKKIVIK